MKKKKKRQLRKFCAYLALDLCIFTAVTLFILVQCAPKTEANTHVVETKINSAEWIKNGTHGQKLLLSTDAGEYYYIPYDMPVFVSKRTEGETYSKLLQIIQSTISSCETVYITVPNMKDYLADPFSEQQHAIEIKNGKQVLLSSDGYNENEKSRKIEMISLAGVVLVLGISYQHSKVFD